MTTPERPKSIRCEFGVEDHTTIRLAAAMAGVAMKKWVEDAIVQLAAKALAEPRKAQEKPAESENTQPAPTEETCPC